jgi:hypothetical protein
VIPRGAGLGVGDPITRQAVIPRGAGLGVSGPTTGATARASAAELRRMSAIESTRPTAISAAEIFRLVPSEDTNASLTASRAPGGATCPRPRAARRARDPGRRDVPATPGGATYVRGRRLMN